LQEWLTRPSAALRADLAALPGRFALLGSSPLAPAVCALLRRADRTIAYRRHLWSLGVAEAMDTAQRGMGLDWAAAHELIRRSLDAMYVHPWGRRNWRGAGSRIAAYHVCDWKVPTAGTVLDRGLPGEGVIDIPAIQAMVGAAGHAGGRRRGGDPVAPLVGRGPRRGAGPLHGLARRQGMAARVSAPCRRSFWFAPRRSRAGTRRSAW
jgi:hypothetical protein